MHSVSGEPPGAGSALFWRERPDSAGPGLGIPSAQALVIPQERRAGGGYLFQGRQNVSKRPSLSLSSAFISSSSFIQPGSFQGTGRVMRR